MQAVRRAHPGIHLFIYDSFGRVLSEMLMAGRLDMAIICGSHAVKGIELQPLLTEDLFLIAPPDFPIAGGAVEPGASVRLQDLGRIDLLLPSRRHSPRQIVDEGLAGIGIVPNVRAEIESRSSRRTTIDTGAGTRPK